MGRVVAPSPPPPARTTDRFKELDGYRGIAVLAIVVFHVFQFCNVYRYLYRGTPAYTILNSLDGVVPFFFVLTAFLLFEPMARSAIEGGRPISGRGSLARPAFPETGEICSNISRLRKSLTQNESSTPTDRPGRFRWRSSSTSAWSC
jgi:hypothetical protein